MAKSPQELLASYFTTSQDPRPVFAVIEAHSLTADKPAGTIITWGTRKSDVAKYMTNSWAPELCRLVKISPC